MSKDSSDTTTTIVERVKRLFQTDDERSSPASAEPDGAGGSWRSVESPTTKTLYGVVRTIEGPYAVGADGYVVRRIDDGWETVLELGPTTKSNPLTCVDVTADGERIWFAGGSGALGAYDVTTGRKHDYTAPQGKTSTWEAIAVMGEAGDETLRVANGSGEVLPAATDEGCPQWGEVVKPRTGSTIRALDADERCYAVDTSGNAFREDADGWADVGIENAQVNFRDLAVGRGAARVAGGSGRVFRYDDACDNWTPIDAGGGALLGIDCDGPRVACVGAGGAVVERTPAGGWATTRTPTEADLHAISLGRPDVAVGAGGTIVEAGSSFD